MIFAWTVTAPFFARIALVRPIQGRSGTVTVDAIDRARGLAKRPFSRTSSTWMRCRPGASAFVTPFAGSRESRVALAVDQISQ